MKKLLTFSLAYSSRKISYEKLYFTAICSYFMTCYQPEETPLVLFILTMHCHVGHSLYYSSPTCHTLVEPKTFPHHFNKIKFNQPGIDVELTSMPSGQTLKNSQ